MADQSNLEVCIAQVNKLSASEKQSLYRLLESEVRGERTSQFHVTFNQDFIGSGRIRTASSDLQILDIED